MLIWLYYYGYIRLIIFNYYYGIKIKTTAIKQLDALHLLVFHTCLMYFWLAVSPLHDVSTPFVARLFLSDVSTLDLLVFSRLASLVSTPSVSTPDFLCIYVPAWYFYVWHAYCLPACMFFLSLACLGVSTRDLLWHLVPAGTTYLYWSDKTKQG